MRVGLGIVPGNWVSGVDFGKYLPVVVFCRWGGGTWLLGPVLVGVGGVGGAGGGLGGARGFCICCCASFVRYCRRLTYGREIGHYTCIVRELVK